MVTVKTVDIRNDFKRISNIVSNGEKVIISRPRNENLIILSEREYNELEKARRNAEYLYKLHESRTQLENGQCISFTMDELTAFENMTTDEVIEFADKRRQGKH